MLTGEWKKSSRSSNTGGNCVEARYLSDEWKKSTRSSNTGGDCVEARALPGKVQIRDSKLGEGSPILELDADTYASLIGGLKRR